MHSKEQTPLLFANETPRILHWVLKVGDLKKATDFLEKVLLMKTFRYEEFPTGCPAECNGPYSCSWNKTMIGYGSEQENFALELTTNQGIDSYRSGDDMQHIALVCDGALERATRFNFPVENGLKGEFLIHGFENYRFLILPKKEFSNDIFQLVALRVSNLEKSLQFWTGFLGMKAFPSEFYPFPHALVGFDENQVKIALIEMEKNRPVEHAQAYGRMAFACSSVFPVYERAIAQGEKVFRAPIVLETPGKADVRVVILTDRDGYEVCFAEAKSFDMLSQMEQE